MKCTSKASLKADTCDILTTSETNFSSSVSVPWCSVLPLKRDDALFYFLRSIDDYFCHPCLLILCLGWIIFISYHLHMIHTTHLKNTQECLCGPYFVTLNSKPSFRPHFLPPSLPQYSRSTYLLTTKKKNAHIYLFLAVLGPCCFARAFSSCGEWGLFFIVMLWLLIVVASLVMEHRL